MSDGISRIDHRARLRNKEKWIVDKIFPAGCLHLLAGPSGIGKSTWMFQQLYLWDQGKPIFGCQSYPCSWMYISCDRGTLETDRTLRRLGFENWDVPIHSIEEVCTSDSADLLKIYERYPLIDLFVIEGIQALIPDTKGSQQRADMLWVSKLRRHMLSNMKTIIATTHTPKQAAQNHSGDRTNALGSTSFLGSASTIINFDVPKDARESKVPVRTDDREVIIRPRDAPDIYLNYTRDKNGLFVDVEDPVTRSQFAMNIFFANHNKEEIVTNEMLKDWAQQSGLDTYELRKWVEEKVSAGRLHKIEPGKFKKIPTQ